MLKKIFLIGFVLLFFNIAVQAETVQLKVGHLRVRDDVTHLSEGVTITRGEIILKALQGIYNEQQKEFELEEEIEMIFAEGRITSRQLQVMLEENIYIFRDNVEFFRESDENEFLLKTPFLELNEEQDSFLAREGVQIEYNNRILQADNADYSGEIEELLLTGNVLIEDEDGDWIKGNSAIFFLGEEGDNFEVDGEVELEIDIGA